MHSNDQVEFLEVHQLLFKRKQSFVDYEYILYFLCTFLFSINDDVYQLVNQIIL